MPNIFEKLGPTFTPQERTALADVFDLDIASGLSAIGSVQSQAKLLESDISVIVTTTSATADAVKLRNGAFSNGVQKIQYVINRGAAQVRVFAPTGGKMNNVLNGSFTLASGTQAAFINIDPATNDIVKL